jgi:hypothetical protein
MGQLDAGDTSLGFDGSEDIGQSLNVLFFVYPAATRHQDAVLRKGRSAYDHQTCPGLSDRPVEFDLPITDRAIRI